MKNAKKDFTMKTSRERNVKSAHILKTAPQ